MKPRQPRPLATQINKSLHLIRPPRSEVISRHPVQHAARRVHVGRLGAVGPRFGADHWVGGRALHRRHFPRGGNPAAAREAGTAAGGMVNTTVFGSERIYFNPAGSRGACNHFVLTRANEGMHSKGFAFNGRRRWLRQRR